MVAYKEKLARSKHSAGPSPRRTASEAPPVRAYRFSTAKKQAVSFTQGSSGGNVGGDANPRGAVAVWDLPDTPQKQQQQEEEEEIDETPAAAWAEVMRLASSSEASRTTGSAASASTAAGTPGGASAAAGEARDTLMPLSMPVPKREASSRRPQQTSAGFHFGELPVAAGSPRVSGTGSVGGRTTPQPPSNCSSFSSDKGVPPSWRDSAQCVEFVLQEGPEGGLRNCAIPAQVISAAAVARHLSKQVSGLGGAGNSEGSSSPFARGMSGGVEKQPFRTAAAGGGGGGGDSSDDEDNPGSRRVVLRRRDSGGSG